MLCVETWCVILQNMGHTLAVVAKLLSKLGTVTKDLLLQNRLLMDGIKFAQGGLETMARLPLTERHSSCQVTDT